MRLAFNAITTRKLALFVLSALIKGISSGRMASLSLFLIVASGMSKKKQSPIPPPTSRSLFFPNLEGCLHLGQAVLSGLGLPECNYLSWGAGWGDSFPLLGNSWTAGEEICPSSSERTLLLARGSLPCLHNKGRREAGGEPPGGRKNWRRPLAPLSSGAQGAQQLQTLPLASRLSPPNFHFSPGKNLGFQE